MRKTRILLVLGTVMVILNVACSAWMAQIGDPVMAAINGIVAVVVSKPTIELWVLTKGRW